MTTTATGDAVADAVSRLRPMGLDEVLAAAELQTRVDRKYVVPLDVFSTVLDQLRDDLHVLQIGTLRTFRYESVYFDTPDLSAYRQHAHGRRRRVKVRTRAYLDSGECLLEFKSVGARGETRKERHPYPFASRNELDAAARALAEGSVGASISPAGLQPVITTTYRRCTLVDPAHGSRTTCDVELHFRDPDGREVGPVDGLVVVESKTLGGGSPVDQELRRTGVRPLSLSKYCVGMALIDPTLPANRWNRELRAHFGWVPDRDPGHVPQVG